MLDANFAGTLLFSMDRPGMGQVGKIWMSVPQSQVCHGSGCNRLVGIM